MDANRSRFHLVLGRSDWGDLPSGLAYDAACESLALRPQLFVFPSRAMESRLTLDMRRGAGVDAFENRYWIAENQTDIRFLSRGERASERFWPVASGCSNTTRPGAFFQPTPSASVPPRALHGLAVTRNHYLVVGVAAPAGLLVFDLSGGGAPQEIRWPERIPFEPFDMAVGGDGRLWILDRAARRLWCLTDRLEIVQLGQAAESAAAAAEFEPVEAGAPREACFRTQEIRIECSVQVPAADPISVEVMADGGVLIACDAGTCTDLLIYRHPFFDPPISLATALEGLVDADETALRAYDVALSQGALFAVGFEGNQAWQLHAVEEDGQRQFRVQPRYFPMRLFTGKALIGGARASYDNGEAWPYLAAQPRPRFGTSGAVDLPARGIIAFDGREPGCLWHRVFLDAAIPSGCAITVAARAADRDEELAGVSWQIQPRPYQNSTGSEIAWAPQRFETWELLLQQVRGRHLQLRLSLAGTARETPRVHALRVYYPRFSYLREYLPAVYREDAESASFLDRYLANPEGTLTAIEGRIQDVELLFDGRSVPEQQLEWLASWIGGVLDIGWDEFRRRLFVRHLIRVQRERGTLGGLLRMLRLTLDACVGDTLFADTSAPAGAFNIRIVESMRTIGAPGVLLGDPSDVQGPGSTTALSTWSPALGAEPLHQRYRTFLGARYGSVAQLNQAWGRTGADTYSSVLDSRLRLQALAPCDGEERRAWQEFVAADIGFTYMTPGAGADDVYRSYLARLYRQPSALNQAYGYSGATALANWADVTPKIWLARLKQSIPPGGPALRDWIRFVSIVLPHERKAHHFTVLIPVRPDEAPEEQQRKAGVARRITEIEKPAHTTFDVKLYFALFRVGEARLGTDTLLGPSSRFAAVLLGTTGLASGYLTDVPPWSIEGRIVAGSEEQCS